MVLVSSDRAADVVSVKECSWSFSHLIFELQTVECLVPCFSKVVPLK